jgi:multidrug resistance efflux pump/putative methionine-R-sulfoxide reductase with GAF domain
MTHINLSDETTVNLDSLLQVLVERISRFMGAERSTLFLFDDDKQELWSRIKQGHDLEEIRLKLEQGIAGYVMHSGERVNVANAYDNPHFDPRFDEQSGFRTRSMLCLPLKDYHGERIGVIQVLNKQDNGIFSALDEELLHELAAQAAISIENAQLYQHLKDLRNAEQKLTRSLEDKHKQLQDAYLHIEANKQQAEDALRKAKVTRRVSFILIFLLLGSGYWLWSAGHFDSFITLQASTETVEDDDGMVRKEYLIQPDTVADSMVLSSNIEPLKILRVMSTLGGKIDALHFEYGDLVEKGDLLLEIESRKELIDLRKAKADYLTLENEVEMLRNWEQSPEARTSKRFLEMARQELEQARRKLEEDRHLFNLKILSRVSLESSEQAVKSKEFALEKAAEDYTSARMNSTKDLRSKMLQLDSQGYELELLEKRVAGSRIIAEVSGVILMAQSEDNDASLEVGMTVDEGKLLFSIADMEGITAKATADETQVKKLKVGQKAKITGPAFSDITLHGTVEKIATEADFGGDFRGAPKYALTAVVPKLSKAQRQSILLGMTCEVEIVFYEDTNAIVIPFMAINQDGEEPTVAVLQEDGSTQDVVIKTGINKIDRVEILAGLEMGQTIVYEGLPDEDTDR